MDDIFYLIFPDHDYETADLQPVDHRGDLVDRPGCHDGLGCPSDPAGCPGHRDESHGAPDHHGAYGDPAEPLHLVGPVVLADRAEKWCLGLTSLNVLLGIPDFQTCC